MIDTPTYEEYAKGLTISISAAIYLGKRGEWLNYDAIRPLYERQEHILEAMDAARLKRA